MQEKKFKKLEKQAEEYLNGWKRALADYENLKKQINKQQEEFSKFANLNLIMQIIPVYNNLKLALEHSNGDDWAKGIQHIKNQFQQILEQNGVEEILPQIGDKFDINEHEAVLAVNSQQLTVNNNKIKKIINCGYKLNGKVIVPAKVVVK